jgi:aspartate carbamoyltransferase regulatory subunit
VEEELRVKKIREGTVIDHIAAGNALAVLKILGLTGLGDNVVSIVMNVPSQKLAYKDIVKIEGRELNPSEVDKISLIAPKASINIIRNYAVVDKQNTKMPSVIRGIIECANLSCISNSKEPMSPLFIIEKEEPLKLRCHYCNRVMNKTDIIDQF